MIISSHSLPRPDDAIPDQSRRTETAGGLLAIYCSAMFTGCLLALPLLKTYELRPYDSIISSAPFVLEVRHHVQQLYSAVELLFGFSLGFFLFLQLRRIFRMSTVWITGLSGAAVSLTAILSRNVQTSAWMMVVVSTISGVFLAVLWCAWLEGIRVTIPNHRRWEVTLRAGIAMMSFGLIAALGSFLKSTTIVSSEQSGILGICLLTGLLPIPLIVRSFSGFSGRLQGSSTLDLTEFQRTADGCCSADNSGSCDDIGDSVHSHHDHDHDHDHSDDASCGVAPNEAGQVSGECCGGQKPAAGRVPVRAGLFFVVSGFLLLFGPLMTGLSEAVITQRFGWGFLWLSGFGLTAGVWMYRRSSGLTGNAIALPLFLLAAAFLFPTFALCDWAGAPVFLISLLLICSLTAVSGSFDGLLAIVRESYSSADEQTIGNHGITSASYRIQSTGAMLSALLCGLAAGLLKMGLSAELLFFVVVPVVSCLLGWAGLRLIPQPMVVTRFAERYLKPVTIESHSAEGSR